MPRILLLLLLLLPEYVWACSCGRIGIGKSYKDADFVFTGKLIQSTVTTHADTIGKQQDNYLIKQRRLVHFTFKINHLYKGNWQADTISITTTGGGADCGYFFSGQNPYLIYSWYTDQMPWDMREKYHPVSQFLTTSVCSRTQRNSFTNFYENLILMLL